jgi:PadR family transcriptional regulator AphA
MTQTNELSTTSFAVLGLLTFGEMSGYDVMKLAEQSIGHFWSPAKSHVYAELRRLAASGLATERHVEQETRPNKRLYAITPEGEAALRRWLEESPVEPSPVKSTLTLKVFFGNLVSPQALRSQVEAMKSQAEAHLSVLRGIEDEIKDNDALLYPYLTLKAGLAHCDADVAWTQEVLDELDRREGE